MKLKFIKNEYLMFFGYCIYLIACIFIESEIHNFVGMDNILRLLKYFGILLCIISCHNISKINEKNFYVMFILFLLATINMLSMNGGSGLIEILILVFCFAIKKTNVEKIFESHVKILLITHVFVIFLSAIGIINDVITSRWFGNYMGSFFAGEYIRHQMGFLTSNQIPLTLMIIYIMFIVYKQGKIHFYENVFFLLANFYCFFNFGSRVSFLLIIFTFFLYELVKVTIKYHPKNKKLYPVCWMIFPLSGFVSILSAYLYNPSSKGWFIANQIFYNRIKWSHNVLIQYGISLLGFGNTIGNATGVNGENIIDNSYISVLMEKGLIIFIIVVVIWSYITYRAEKEKNYYLLISLIVLAIASLIDGHLISYKVIPFYCIFALDKYKNLNLKSQKVKGKVIN